MDSPKKEAQNDLVQGNRGFSWEGGGDMGHDPERGNLPKDQGEHRRREF